MITDGTTAVQAFEAGEVDVLYQSLPPDEIARLKETPEYEQYPGLGTYYYGFNVKNITDVKQRRAMSLAIDRQSIIDNIAQGGPAAGDRLHAEGHAGLRRDQPGVAVAAADGDMEQAKQLMGEVANPKKNITLYINDSPGHREIAVAIQAAWKELGITSTIKQQELPQYLEFLGPPPNSRRRRLPARLDRRLRRRDQLPRALDLRVGEQQHELLQQGLRRRDREGDGTTEDNDARYKLYGEAEDILVRRERRHADHARSTGTRTSNLERESVKDTFSVNLLNQIDLTKVVVTE